MTTRRHNWKLHSGDSPSSVYRCARCGLLKRTEKVQCSRVTLNTATLWIRDVDVFSWRGQKWRRGRPECPGAVPEALRPTAERAAEKAAE